VPSWQEPCILGAINVSVVQMWLPLPGLNASAMTAYANVYDAWATAFARQLGGATAIPASQLRPVFFGRCPPPPSWLGNAAYDYAKQFIVDCLSLEFVEEPGAAFALGLTSRAALYRIAAAIGATTNGVNTATNFGAWQPSPLSQNGVTPSTHLLTPLWQPQPVQGSNGAPYSVLTGATWRFINVVSASPGGPRAAPSIVPGARFPGVFDGRFIDMESLVSYRGTFNSVAGPVDIRGYQAALAAFVIFFVAAGAYTAVERYRLGSRASRPQHTWRNQLCILLCGRFARTKQSAFGAPGTSTAALELTDRTKAGARKGSVNSPRISILDSISARLAAEAAAASTMPSVVVNPVHALRSQGAGSAAPASWGTASAAASAAEAEATESEAASLMPAKAEPAAEGDSDGELPAKQAMMPGTVESEEEEQGLGASGAPLLPSSGANV
jgi:hypothetical protein